MLSGGGLGWGSTCGPHALCLQSHSVPAHVIVTAPAAPPTLAARVPGSVQGLLCAFRAGRLAVPLSSGHDGGDLGDFPKGMATEEQACLLKGRDAPLITKSQE